MFHLVLFSMISFKTGFSSMSLSFELNKTQPGFLSPSQCPARPNESTLSSVVFIPSASRTVTIFLSYIAAPALSALTLNPEFLLVASSDMDLSTAS